MQILYLPELRDEHQLFQHAVDNYKNWLAVGMSEVGKSIEDGEPSSQVISEYMSTYDDIIVEFQPALKAIFEKAKKIAESINC